MHQLLHRIGDRVDLLLNSLWEKRGTDLILTVVTSTTVSGVLWTPPQRPRPLPPRLTEAEAAAHAAFVADLGEQALWTRL